MNNSDEDRRWIERLRELPKYRALVDKLVLGASPDAVTDWLMQETDHGPLSGLSRSTVHLYVIGLKVQIESNSRKSTEKGGTDQSQRPTQLANEFTGGTTSKADPATKQPESIDEESKATETQNLNSMTSGGIVRQFLEMQLPHIHRMAKWEKQHNMPHPGWEPSLQLLLDAAKILQENESRDKRSATSSKADIPVSKPQPSEETQRLAKLTKLDHKRSREDIEDVKAQLKSSTKDAPVN